MNVNSMFLLALASAAVLGLPSSARPDPPLSLVSARVAIEGTSNIHAYTASTTTVRVTRLQLAEADGGDPLEQALRPGALQAFDIAIPVATLTSPKEGIDKNMHKALKAAQHPEITFRLHTVEPAGRGPGEAIRLRVSGTLRIAGVDREVMLDAQAVRTGSRLTVSGGTDLLMTDWGVTPPRAMLGVLRTNPQVRVHFEVVLTAASPAATERDGL